jgi:hypothetical protein
MRFLRDDRHPPSKGLPRERCDVPSVDENPAARRSNRSGQYAEQRGLSRSVRAKDADESACGECHRDVAQDGRVPISKDDAIGPKQIRHRVSKTGADPHSDSTTKRRVAKRFHVLGVGKIIDRGG